LFERSGGGVRTSERAPDFSAYYDAMATFLLYESASGYALFEGLDMDEIGQTAEAVQETITYVPRPFHTLQGTIFWPIVGSPPAHARGATLRKPDRATRGSRARRLISRNGRLGDARAASNPQPSPAQTRAVEKAETDRSLGLLEVCGGVGGRDWVSSLFFVSRVLSPRAIPL
jgi:hypothetical protein